VWAMCAAAVAADDYSVTKISEKSGIRTDLRPIPIGLYAPEVNKTFVTWMTANSHAVVKAYDHKTGVWSEDRIVGRSTFADKHNYPGMLRGADNRIYIFYGCHNSPLRMTVSPKPLSIDGEWTDVAIPEAAMPPIPRPSSPSMVTLRFLP